MCEEEPFTKYNDWAKYGCMKLVGEHLTQLLGPWNGQRSMGDRSSVVVAKRNVSVVDSAGLMPCSDAVLSCVSRVSM